MVAVAVMRNCDGVSVDGVAATTSDESANPAKMTAKRFIEGLLLDLADMTSPSDFYNVIYYNIYRPERQLATEVRNSMTEESSRKAVKRRGYHHGDLRRDLLRVAREEIARHGARAVSMTSLAHLIGVSQPALYRHFADRDALLEAVAAEAFDEFSNSLALAAADQAPIDALQAISLAYVAFGEGNMEIYRLMFATQLTPRAEASSPLNQASARAFEQLLTVLSAISPAAAVQEDAYLLWAQLHGLVMLKADGFIVGPLKKFVGSERGARTALGKPQAKLVKSKGHGDND